MTETLIGGLSVLEVGSDRNVVAGKILSDLGAGVIRVARRGGDSARRRAPFYARTSLAPGESLFWHAYGTGRRSLTLNPETSAGRAILRRLLRDVDVFVRCDSAESAHATGLDAEALFRLNPRLISVSITPFGSSGPLSSFAGPDLVIQAMGGLMQISGDEDRAPTRITVPQAYLHAGAEAVCGILMALAERNRSGLGQVVDVSAQECAVWTLMNAQQFWDLNRINLPRGGAVRPQRTAHGFVRLRSIYPCRDGHVCLYVRLGPMSSESMYGLVNWMEEVELAPAWLLAIRWEELNMLEITQRELDPLEAAFSAFFQRLTKAELGEGAVARRILLMPVNTVEDIYRDRQLQSRDYWQSIDSPTIGKPLRYPGPFARFSAAPVSAYSAAPEEGDANRSIPQGRIGLSTSELKMLRASNAL